MRFLQQSCKSYDEGFKDEGIRIAVIIRLLMHETKNQRPLLRSLDAMHINLATTCNGPSGRAVIYSGFGQVSFSDAGIKHSAKIQAEAIQKQIPLNEWWGQTIHLLGSVRQTRRSVVLAAAEKDGGAHVDSKLTVEYQSLLNLDGSGYWSILAPDGITRTPITDAHLVFLRQMGFELLNSPELLGLCRV
jgi:hypothetical protein